jgi:hypothetical protein
VAADEQGRTLALLNGDMPPGAPPPTNPVSRGVLLMELLEDPRPQVVRAALTSRRDGRMPFRPFKLILATPGTSAGVGAAGGADEAWLLRAEWDGAALTFSELRGDTCLVSSTLQPLEAAAARGAAFARFAAELPLRGGRRDAQVLAAAQQRFHASHSAEAPEGGPLTVCMHRPEARTVSSTQVLVAPGEVSMRYQPGWPHEGRPASMRALPRAG